MLQPPPHRNQPPLQLLFLVALVAMQPSQKVKSHHQKAKSQHQKVKSHHQKVKSHLQKVRSHHRKVKSHHRKAKSHHRKAKSQLPQRQRIHPLLTAQPHRLRHQVSLMPH
jgi:uncharacterized protein (DUF3084 family)